MKAHLFHKQNTAEINGIPGRLFLSEGDDARIRELGLVCFIPEKFFAAGAFARAAYLVSPWATFSTKAWGESSAHHAIPDINRPVAAGNEMAIRFLHAIAQVPESVRQTPTE